MSYYKQGLHKNPLSREYTEVLIFTKTKILVFIRPIQ